MPRLTHTDREGRARMVDVSHKPEECRVAQATGRIALGEETLELIRTNLMKKGDVLTVAEIAGIQTAKRTPELIPLCHTVPLSRVSVRARLEKDGVRVDCETACVGTTGVEMEALAGVSGALLSIYDMCKAVDKTMEISGIRLLSKTKTPVASKKRSPKS